MPNASQRIATHKAALRRMFLMLKDAAHVASCSQMVWKLPQNSGRFFIIANSDDEQA